MEGISEQITMEERLAATLKAHAVFGDQLEIHGFYVFECIGADGTRRWRDVIANTVMTLGKNGMLDNFLSGSAFTQTGPFMGFISSTSFSAISAADTMTSHAGWLEGGNANAPTYTSPRKLCVFSAASAGAKALSAPLSFPITGVGTIKGAFIVLMSGALSTIDNTGGTLFSAGLFISGDRPVQVSDTVNASYSASL